MRHSLTRLTSDSTTRLRLSDSVPDTANKLSSSRVGCVRCGVRTAMDQLLRSREAGAHLVIISASEGEDSLSSLDLDSLTEYVDYYNIRLSSLVLHMSGSLSSHYSELAGMSGGVFRHFLQQWIHDTDCFIGLHDRKLCVLGLVHLLQMPDNAAVAEISQQLLPSGV